MSAYTITIWNRGRRIVRRYPSLADAQQAASRIFTATGVIVGIEGGK